MFTQNALLKHFIQTNVFVKYYMSLYGKTNSIISYAIKVPEKTCSLQEKERKQITIVACSNLIFICLILLQVYSVDTAASRMGFCSVGVAYEIRV